MCIWNGDSNGTLTVFHYAQKTGKQAWLASFIEWFGKEEFRLKVGDTDFKPVFHFEDENHRKAFIDHLRKQIMSQM
jgi:hypothetical protein